MLQYTLYQNDILYKSEQKHLPIPVYTYTRPTLSVQFLLQLLLCMNHYETEVDLLLHSTLRDSFRADKLIGPSDDPENLKLYSNKLLCLFIHEQLKYFHNTLKTLSMWIVIASKLFDSVIVRNEIPITDMSPVESASLRAAQLEEIIKYWE